MKRRAIKTKNITSTGASLGPPAALSSRMAVPATTETRHASRPPLSTPHPGKGILLELVNTDAQSVFVAGSFNDWNPQRTPLRRDASGHWIGDVMLEPGRHEYLFVVDGKWMPDPKAREHVSNPFGGTNSVVVVTG